MIDFGHQYINITLGRLVGGGDGVVSHIKKYQI